MMGAKYGLCLALLMVALGEWAPQPAGSIVLWTLLSIQAAVGVRLIWRHLRLPWCTAGGVAALSVFVAMAVLCVSSGRGLNLATIVTVLPLSAVIVIWGAVMFVPLCLGLEALRNSPEWRAWSAHMERASLWEMVTFHHIPNLGAKSDP